MTLLEVMEGNENLKTVQLSSKVWYVQHSKCPIALESNSCRLSMLQKSGRIGANGETIGKIRVEQLFIDPKNQTYAEKLKLIGWYKTVYDCPDNLILKIDVTEHLTEFGKTSYRGLIFIRMRSTGPEWQLRYSRGHGHDLLGRGRFDILSPEEVINLGLIGHPLETKFLDQAYIQQFVKMEVTKPAIVEILDTKELVEVDGVQMEVIRRKNLRRVGEVY